MEAPKGELIREARLRAGLRQVDLADLIGTTRTTIARFERGEATPRMALTRGRLWQFIAETFAEASDNPSQPDPETRLPRAIPVRWREDL